MPLQTAILDILKTGSVTSKIMGFGPPNPIPRQVVYDDREEDGHKGGLQEWNIHSSRVMHR